MVQISLREIRAEIPGIGTVNLSTAGIERFPLVVQPWSISGNSKKNKKKLFMLFIYINFIIVNGSNILFYHLYKTKYFGLRPVQLLNLQ